MGKLKKSFKQYTDENDGFKKPKVIGDNSRKNTNQQFKRAVQEKNWDEIDDEYYGTRNRFYRR